MRATPSNQRGLLHGVRAALTASEAQCPLARLARGAGGRAGKMQVQVHYYEDGNVQLQSTKEIEFAAPASVRGTGCGAC